LATVTVNEGEIVSVTAVANDPDGDAVSISYSSPLAGDGTWATSVGDAGTYLATVTASDGSVEAQKTVTIVVESVNNAPVIVLDDVAVLVQKGESSTVMLEPQVSDADGDDIQVTYTGWMTSNSKVVTDADEGEYEVSVSASDGIQTSVATITVTVDVNTPPDFDFGI